MFLSNSKHSVFSGYPVHTSLVSMFNKIKGHYPIVLRLQEKYIGEILVISKLNKRVRGEGQLMIVK